MYRMYSKKTMGKIIGEKYLEFNGAFFTQIIERINPIIYTGSIGNDYFNIINNGKVDTNILCPFCNTGNIILKDIKKDIDKDYVEHIGNTYYYICSNDECKAKFEYYKQWRWIN